MKKLSLNLSLDGITINDEEKKNSPVKMCTLMIKNIILNWGAAVNRGGLNEDDRRKFYKISDVLDKAEKENILEVELEDDWFGLIKKCKRESNLMPNDLMRRVEELIDAVPDR